MKQVSWFSQAFSRLSNTHTQSSQPNSRRRSRHLKRRALLENLESRQLLAADNTPPVAVGGWVDLQHNAPHQISVADLNYSDADNDPLTSLTVQTLPNLGTLELYGHPVYAGQEVYASEIQFGYFNYVPTGDAGTSYSASFSFSVSDGWDSSASTASLGFQVTVTPNSPPTIAGSNHQLNSPQSHTLTIADFGYSDADGDALQSITILNPPSLGTLQYYGFPISSGQTFYSYDIEWGYLTYVPNPTANATYQDSFTFKANDGFDDSLPATVAYTVNVTPNSPPVVTGSTRSLPGNQSHTLTIADFGYSDPDGDALQTITILNAPNIGTLQYYGFPISSGQSFSSYEFDWGYLTYVPSPAALAPYHDAFSFVANDGRSESSPAFVGFSVNVTPNSPPTAIGSSHSLSSTGAHAITLADLGYSDPDGDALQSITILNPPSNGTLEYYGFPIQSGQWLSAGDIAGGYLTYRANPYHGSAYQDAFTFTANDGNRESASATIHFSVTAGGNTAPTTTNPQISLDPSGVTTLSVDNFPYFDADGDALTAITILSLPTSGALKLWGQAVTIGQEISAYELESGALELWVSPSSGGNAATTFSFSTSDGIDSSAAATMSATHAGQANSRPLTWTASITASPNEIAFLNLQTFPFEDPDDDTLSHVTIHAVPAGAAIVDALGNPLSLPATLTAAMLAAGEVGLLSDAPPTTQFGIVFSVSDGQLTSSHSVLTVEVLQSSEPTPDNGLVNIELGRLSGPTIVLADGYVPSSTTLPPESIVAGWLASDTSNGTIVFGDDDHWVYTESLDLGPAMGFNESLGYVFVANGFGTTVTYFSVDIVGIHDPMAEETDDPDPDGSPSGEPSDQQPNDAFPVRPQIQRSLQYHFSVTLDPNGDVIQFNRSGHYHNSYYFALIDQPLGSDEDEAQKEHHQTFLADGSSTSSTSGTFTIIVAAWTMLHFDETGTTVDLGDEVHFSYQGEGSYAYDPTTATSGYDDDTDQDASQDDSPLPPVRSGLVSGTYSFDGLHDYHASIIGRILLDDKVATLTITSIWVDETGSSFDGDGSYQEGDTIGTIVERGSARFIDTGSVVTVFTGDDFTLTGTNSLTTIGDGYYFESWTAPIESDDDEIKLSGNTWGTLLSEYSYHDEFDFQLQLIPIDDDENSDDSTDGLTSDAPTHRWSFISGSFDDFSQFISTDGYQATGTYHSTAGSAPDRTDRTRPTNTPLFGSVLISGNDRSSILLSAKGSITPDETNWDFGTLELFNSSDSLAIIDAEGIVDQDDFVGLITFYDRQQTSFSRDLTFDLTKLDMPAVGTGYDFILSDTRFDQTITGTLEFDDMSGNQWAVIQDHAYLAISVAYQWINEESKTNDSDANTADADPTDDGENDDHEHEKPIEEVPVFGWQPTTANFTLLIDSSFDIGYDVTGIVTRDNLSGVSSEIAYEQGVDFTSLVINLANDPAAVDEQLTPEDDNDPGDDANHVGDPSTTTVLLSNFSRQNHFLRSHDLAGTRTSEPMAPSGVIVSGLETDFAHTETTSSISVSVSFDSKSDTKPTVSGAITFDSQVMVDTGFSGTGNYSRTDGDTTFTGSATHAESFFSNQRLRLFRFLDNDGQWQLSSSPITDVSDAAPTDSLLWSQLDILYDHTYWATGTIDDVADYIQWDQTIPPANEAGQIRSDLSFSTLGIPRVVTNPANNDENAFLPFDDPEQATPDGDDGNAGDNDIDNLDTASPLPKLDWTYSGVYRSELSFNFQSIRDAFGIYDSGILTGPISQSIYFTATAAHEDQFDVQPDGSLKQASGENRVESNLRFTFNLSLSGDIDDDNPHSDGLTGTISVANHLVGGSYFFLHEQFIPDDGGSWDSVGESRDWSNFNNQSAVNLEGSVNHSLGDVSSELQVSSESVNHASGTTASRFTLHASRPADQPATEDAWLQIIGIEMTDQVTQTESTLAGQSSGGMIEQTTRNRSEHSTWAQLLAPESEPGTGQWGDGGKSVDDYFFSLTEATQRVEKREQPLGDNSDLWLMGDFRRNTSNDMLVRSSEGRTFGDGAQPPQVNHVDLGDLADQLVLPTRAPQTGTAAGPDADDPNGGSDWASGNYGRIHVSHSGSSDAGFDLAGDYTIDAAATSPGQATRNISSQHLSSYNFLLTKHKSPSTGTWRNTSGSRETNSAWGENSTFIVSGDWSNDQEQLSVSGPFLDSQIETKSGSSQSESQFDPSSGTWTDVVTSHFLHDIDIVRTSEGSGSYSHDRFGFEVSGSVTVANEHRYRLHHSTQHIYVNGVLSSESSGDRYTELTTRSMHSSSGSGFDDSTSTSSAPYFYYLGEPVGNQTTTATRDHTASESNHRDFGSRDRSDWRFDSATGQLVPTRRVQTHDHVVDTSLDVTYDTDVNTELEGSYTVPAAWYAPTPRTHELDGGSQRRTVETFSSGQNSSSTTTSTTPLEGAGAGEAIVLVTGSDAVSHSSYARSDSHSRFYNVEVNGSGSYFFQQSSTDDYYRSTFDSHRSTQRIDGTGDTHCQGNRTQSGNGWMSHWTLRQFEEFEPEQGSDHMPLFPEDDRPDSYDVTLGNSFEASADTPIAYGYSTTPPVNTPPGGSLGPGSFSPLEDSQSIISFFGDVAMAGSTALMDHAARDAAFAELAAETEPSCDPADPHCEAIDTTETGPEAMRRYAEGQGALPTQEIPEAIRIEIADGEDMWIINPDQLTNPPAVTGDSLCPCGCGSWLPDSSGPGDGTGGPGGVIRLPLAPREPWNPGAFNCNTASPVNYFDLDFVGSLIEDARISGDKVGQAYGRLRNFGSDIQADLSNARVRKSDTVLTLSRAEGSVAGEQNLNTTIRDAQRSTLRGISEPIQHLREISDGGIAGTIIVGGTVLDLASLGQTAFARRALTTTATGISRHASLRFVPNSGLRLFDTKAGSWILRADADELAIKAKIAAMESDFFRLGGS